MANHARLAPSSAERWLACPASVRMELVVPEEPESVYAAEGTAAHSLFEIKASQAFGMRGDVETQRLLDQFREDTEYLNLSEEQEIDMDRYVEEFIELVREKLAEHENAVVLFEQRMATGVPECWGTSDVVIVSEEHVEIIDLKYGQGVYVEAEGNPQLRLYALGALDTFADMLGETKEIRITVHQPRLGHTSTEILTPKELRTWRKKVIPIAEVALGDDAPFGPSDEACRWCPASGRCRAQLESVFSQDFEVKPDTLDPEEMAETLAKIPEIRNWLNAFEEAALDTAYSQGVHIPGWKVVMSGGRRSISNSEGAKEALALVGYNEDQVSRRSLLGIGDLEKLLGKDDFNTILGHFITKSEGKPSLVHESDQRPAATPNAEAAKVFGKEPK